MCTVIRMVEGHCTLDKACWDSSTSSVMKGCASLSSISDWLLLESAMVGLVSSPSSVIYRVWACPVMHQWPTSHHALHRKHMPPLIWSYSSSQLSVLTGHVGRAVLLVPVGATAGVGGGIACKDGRVLRLLLGTALGLATRRS